MPRHHMSGGTKALLGLGVIGAVAVAGVGIAKAKSKAALSGEPLGGGNVAVKGKSGISWVLSPTGEQTGPAYGTMTWIAYATPGTKFKNDTGQDVTLPESGLVPVVTFMQVGTDVKTRAATQSWLTGKGWSNLLNAALTDLGITANVQKVAQA